MALTRDSSENLIAQDSIRAITADTLILWGEKDNVTPLSDGEKLAQLLPNSQLQVLSELGHQPFEEDPKRFNEALIAFLKAGN